MIQPSYSNPSMTPTDVDQRRKLAQALMQQGTDASPVGHWTQGLARVLQGGMGGYYGRTASDAEKEGIASRGAFMQQAMKDPAGAAASGIHNAWTTDMAGNIGQKVIGQKLEQSDPMYQLRRQQAQADLEMVPLKRQAIEADIAGKGLAQKVTEANLAQLKTATPEYRASIAEKYGLRPGTPEYNSFVVNGKYEAPDPIMQSIADKLRGNVQAPPSPIRPQSFNGQDGGPGVVLTQAGGQPTPPQPPMVNIPGMGQMPKDQAETLGLGLALKGKGDAGKMIMDGVNAGNIGKEGQNDLDKKMIAASDNLANLSSVRAQFRPEFQQIENRLGMAWTAFADKFKKGQTLVRPEDRAQLEAFSAYRSDALDTMNNYIKAITGAAMTDAEAKRILGALPAVGEGIFDGDGPTAFKAKLDAAIDKIAAAIARYNYARQNGKDWQMIGIEQMKSVVRQRGAQLEQQLRSANPGADKATLQSEVTKQLKREFGI